MVTEAEVQYAAEPAEAVPGISGIRPPASDIYYQGRNLIFIAWELGILL